MSFHQVQTARPVLLFSSAFVARDLRPLPWFTYSCPALA